ncbi:MAG: sulfatase-like hydrolase/transferase [Candidatus Pseudobacter hemicellulosilyticus]|uniref:Sulfatase-like hydrolase/transferase n=1 Tax=Candidatus Pseudobacter hemicellulosilyticus TaxID=3121375 RepID=A0AAJ5WU80_9BACT|nr:MAG: sulfatase-like hydrolase/transferase [Pseudobacter sp.]
MKYIPTIAGRSPRVKKIIVIIHLVVCLCLEAGLSVAQTRPNIVIFIADDLNQQDVGCYGNIDVRTPNMDQMAREGMRFNNAYATSPMCTPSRSSLFTGLYPHRNGSQMNHFTVHADTRSLPHYLQELGYRVVLSGKTHISPEDKFPFEYIGKEFGQYAPTENRVDKKKETVQLIEDHFASRAEQPLCLIVAPWLPHVPWFPNRDFDPQQLKLPPYLADTKETRGALAAYYQSISAADKMLGEVLAALDKAGKKDNTAVFFTSDQGVQFPSAKWTVYDLGLRVPMIVRWPGKVTPGKVSDALVSLVDVTPTFIDLAGGKPVKTLDGSSFREVLQKGKQEHHPYIFAETSVEPHFWYNYTPARSVITAQGLHYIKNYHPGERFITHIDKVERNEYYFESWEKDALTNERTKFLLDRYSYRPPEELFDLTSDPAEFKNLASEPVANAKQLKTMRALLEKELKRQGETEAMILEGPLPVFSDKSYTIRQNKSASELSFNRKVWNPDLLYISAYLEGIDAGGVICDYFNNFKLFAYEGKIGIELADGSVLETGVLPATKGHLLFSLSSGGELDIQFNHQSVFNKQLGRDLTRIKAGYVTCGIIQGQEYPGRLRTYRGTITDLRFTMNELSGKP